MSLTMRNIHFYHLANWGKIVYGVHYGGNNMCDVTTLTERTSSRQDVTSRDKTIGWVWFMLITQECGRIAP